MVPEPTIQRVARVEALAPGARASRRLVCAMSDGTEQTAVEFYDDEVLISEGDLVGLTLAQARAVHFRRDREYLRRDDED